MDIYRSRSKKFSLDVEALMKLPASVYYKDVRGVYFGCNDIMAELGEHQSRHDVDGFDDIELLGVERAHEFVNNDNFVLKQGGTLITQESFVNEYAVTLTGLTTKLPLYDDEDELVGIFGITFIENIPIQSYDNVLNTLAKSINKVSKGLGPTLYLQEFLTPREKECAILTAKGLSACNIAEELAISKRTVETHLDSVKSKLNCNNKVEMVVKALKYKHITLGDIS